MPHDKNGRELKVGDTVLVEMLVSDIYPGAEMCEVHLRRDREDEQSLSMMAQAKQVSKVVHEEDRQSER